MSTVAPPPRLYVGHIGSCLSADPIAHMVAKFNCEEVFRIHNNRSDQIVENFIRRSKKQIPLSWLREFLDTKPEFADDNAKILENQYEPTIGFEGTLRGRNPSDGAFATNIGRQPVDIILLDNFMDTVAKLLFLRNNDQDFSPVFFPSHVNNNLAEIEERFDFTDYISPEVSAAMWIEIAEYLRGLHPRAAIYHICWSHSTSRRAPERMERILAFDRAYSAVAQSLGIKVIRPLDLPDELTAGEEDWYHLHRAAYEALAGHIYLDFISSTKVLADIDGSRDWTFPDPVVAPVAASPDPVVTSLEESTAPTAPPADGFIRRLKHSLSSLSFQGRQR